jgi:hypothetical protein
MTPLSDIDAALTNLRSALAELVHAGVRVVNKDGALWVAVRDCHVETRGSRDVIYYDSEAALRRELAGQVVAGPKL